MSRKDRLEKAIEKARLKLRAIEESENMQASKSLVGKYFKYRNSYSSQNHDDWWLYVTVTGVTESGDPLSWSFQKDNYGKVEVGGDTFRLTLLECYDEIAGEEFWESYDDIMRELNERRPSCPVYIGRRFVPRRKSKNA